MQCSICGRDFSELFGGVCTECMSISAREISREQEREAHKLEEGFYQNDRLTPIIPGRGYFGSICYKPEGGAVYKKTEDGNYVELTESEKDTAFNRMLDVGGFSEKDRKSFLPSIKMLYKKYEPFLVSGEYLMCKKADYGSKCSGVVVDKHGGVMVYRLGSAEFFDPEKVRTNSYVADDEIITSEYYEE